MLPKYSNAINYDKSIYDYVTVPYEEYYTIKDDIEWSLTSMSYYNDTLRENYTLENMFKDDTKAVSITYKRGMPYQISTVISRPIFNNALRICNRFFQIPTDRSKTLIGFDLRTMIEMIASQQNMFLDSQLFISREKNVKTLDLMTKWINCFTSQSWQVQKQKYMVCEGEHCNQYIASNYLKPDSQCL